MKRKPLLLLSTFLCLASQISQAQHPPMGTPMAPDPAPKASDLTVAQLLAKHAAARGGEQLKALQSVTMTGTWATTQSKPSPITVTITPGRYLRRIENPDTGVSYRAVDGKQTWEITPQLGINKPTPMVPKDAARYARLADPQGALINPEGKKNKVGVIGKTSWRGSDVYKLKVTYPDGSSNFIYLDAKNFLTVRVVETLWVNQLKKEFDLEIVYEDYRDVNGVKWAFTEKVKAPDVGFAQTVTWKTIEPNKAFDQAIFKGPKD
jgi:hypothetical protein